MSGHGAGAGAGGGGSAGSRSAKARALGLGRRGKAPPIQDDLMKIMYGYGDDKQVEESTLALVESMVKDYIYEVCRQAYDVALIGKKAGCRDELTVQDFNFMTRKDTRRYERLKEILAAYHELKGITTIQKQKLVEEDA